MEVGKGFWLLGSARIRPKDPTDPDAPISGTRFLELRFCSRLQFSRKGDRKI
jgi:hypothetical protein